MIRYALCCQNGHSFESWFKNSEAYSAQKQAGLLVCPFCDSPQVEKQIMAPSIVSSSPLGNEVHPIREGEEGSVEQMQFNTPISPVLPSPFLSPQQQEGWLALRRQIEQQAEHVGTRFTEEARKMHYGEAEERTIYGSASLEDVKEMKEEGIPVLALPPLPEEQN